MLLQRWIVRALTSLTLRLSKVLRLSHRRAAQQLLPQQPWACLPHDVISRMSQDLERKQLGALRLVCKAWRRSTDDVLEHLELTRFPSTLSYLDRFPVIKSLNVVKPGSRPCSPVWGTPLETSPALKRHHHHRQASPAQPSSNSGAAPSQPCSSTLPPPSFSSGHRAARSRGLQVQVPVTSIQEGIASPELIPIPQQQQQPAASPQTTHLSALLRALNQRRVRVRHLALFYDAPQCVAQLPPGLESLTLVNLKPASADTVPTPTGPAQAPAAADGQAAAAAGLAAGAPPAPAVGGLNEPAAAAAAGAGGAVGGEPSAHPGVPYLDIPDATWAVLQQLRSLKLVNGLVSMSGLVSCTQLTRLVLQGEAPNKKKPNRRPKTKTLELGSELGRLTGLQELEVRWLRLPELPPSFTSLTQLKSLDVSDCGLHALPESLAALPQLECLTATGNAGLRMPRALAQLSSLRLLNLSWSLWWGCDLDQLFGLCVELKELQELRLTGCSIQQLPPSLRNLTSLRTLVLSANQLEGLPAEVAALTSLECLDCSLNHIAHVDRLPPALRRLNLQTNGLKSLPGDFGRQVGKTLQWLDISNNCLTALPSSMSKLCQLQTLRLSFNQLQDVKAGQLQLPQLQLLEAYFAGCSSVQQRIQAVRKGRPHMVVAC